MYKFREETMSNKDIYKKVMQAKSLLDTIAEQKNLDDDHDIFVASNILNNFLNALEEQDSTLITNMDESEYV